VGVTVFDTSNPLVHYLRAFGDPPVAGGFTTPMWDGYRTVTDPAELGETGVDVGPGALFATIAILLGGCLALAARRRRFSVR
jgi:hypothetical protein